MTTAFQITETRDISLLVQWFANPINTNRLRRYLGRMHPFDEEGIVQDTYISLHEYLADGKFIDGAKLKNLIYTTAIHKVIDEKRKRRSKIRHVSFDDLYPFEADSLQSSTPNPEQSLLDAELERRTEIEIQKLPEIFRVAFNLRRGGDSYAEIAQKLSLPDGTVKTRLKRAKELLAYVQREYAH